MDRKENEQESTKSDDFERRNNEGCRNSKVKYFSHITRHNTITKAILGKVGKKKKNARGE